MKSMMKVMGLCFVAAFVMSAVAAATASASATTPEFRFAAGNKEFSSTGTIGKLETSAGELVECKEETDRGEIEGASPSHRIRDLLISYKGCTSTILTKTYKCQSSKANSEEIKTFNLLARLGWISKPKTEVGILFNPEAGVSGNPNNLFAEFACVKGEETISIKVRGSVIAKITPVNTLINLGGSFLVAFTKGAGKGEPGIKSFEGLVINKLETETTTSKKFIESSAEGEANFFPLVSTEIEA